MTNDFNMPVTPHRLELMDRAHLTVSGVEDVERFDERGVIMPLSLIHIFPGGSMKQMMASLARLAALPGDYRVLPGHMEPSTPVSYTHLDVYKRQVREIEK